MTRILIRKEAMERQGLIISTQKLHYRIEGNRKSAMFEMGGEGLVHRAIPVGHNGHKLRIKCFWEPTDDRLRRSRVLVDQQLHSRIHPKADVLAGAPMEVLPMAGTSRFALVMRDVDGCNWRSLKERAETEADYPPKWWPGLAVRAAWSYGLATAIYRMERRGFVHADLSPGNVMLVTDGADAGAMALVDFDSFVHPKEPRPSGRGTPGYAAPEIWNSQQVSVGSDRLGLAVLVQEFMLAGDPALHGAEAFNSIYDQQRIIAGQAQPHPLFKKKFPELVCLVEAALRASRPDQRPGPTLWRDPLRAVFEKSAGIRGPIVQITSHPAGSFQMTWRARPGERMDLSRTTLAINASLVATSSNVALDVAQGITLFWGSPGSHWQSVIGPRQIQLENQGILYDPAGKCSAQLSIQ